MDGATDDFSSCIQQAKRCDRAAFEAIYLRTLTPVYRYLCARVDRIDEAEELTQEVFFAAIRGIEAFRGDDEPALLAWLFQIARHKIADRLRERYRHPQSPLDEANAVSAQQPGPDEIALAGADEAEIRSALQQLTDDQREVIMCKYILGYDNQKTSVIVGKNTNAVNQLHHRALAALHRILGERQSPFSPGASR